VLFYILLAIYLGSKKVLRPKPALALVLPPGLFGFLKCFLKEPMIQSVKKSEENQVRKTKYERKLNKIKVEKI